MAREFRGFGKGPKVVPQIGSCCSSRRHLEGKRIGVRERTGPIVRSGRGAAADALCWLCS